MGATDGKPGPHSMSFLFSNSHWRSVVLLDISGIKINYVMWEGGKYRYDYYLNIFNIKLKFQLLVFEQMLEFDQQMKYD